MKVLNQENIDNAVSEWRQTHRYDPWFVLYRIDGEGEVTRRVMLPGIPCLENAEVATYTHFETT